MAILPDPKDKTAVMNALRAALGRGISDRVWHTLEVDGSLKRYADEPTPETYEALRKDAARHSRKEPGRKLGQATRKSLDEVLNPAEALRAQVHRQHMVRLASRREVVISLRKQLLGGNLLTQQEAEVLLRQVGIRCFSLEWFTAEGIQLIGHQSYYWDPEHSIPTFGMFFTKETVIRFRWVGGTRDVPDAVRLAAEAWRSGQRLKLAYGEVRCVSSSVLGLVREPASELALLYGWSEADAVMFLLTGQPPRSPAISARQLLVRELGGRPRDHRDCFLELRIRPWVSPATVGRAIRQLQRMMFNSQVRHIGERSLLLFEFVQDYSMCASGKPWEELDQEGVDFRWSQVAGEWNAKYSNEPGWQYEANRMSADFRRTLLALLYRKYQPLLPSKRDTDPSS